MSEKTKQNCRSENKSESPSFFPSLHILCVNNVESYSRVQGQNKKGKAKVTHNANKRNKGKLTLRNDLHLVWEGGEVGRGTHNFAVSLKAR